MTTGLRGVIRPFFRSAQDSNSFETGLSLLKAVPFDFYPKAQRFDWPNEIAARALLKRPANETGPISDLTADPAGRARLKAISRLTGEGAQYKINYTISSPDGTRLHLEECGQLAEMGPQGPARIKGVLRDVSQDSRNWQHIIQTYLHDPLTGALQPARFEERLTAECARLISPRQSCLLLAVSVENLAKINAQYGYRAGDYALQFVADRLRFLVQPPSFMGRMAGDLFVIASPLSAPREFGEWASRISRIGKEPIASAFGALDIKLDVFSHLARNDGRPAIDILRELAPDYDPVPELTGSAGPGLSSGAAPQFSLADVNALFEQGRLTLVFQPIVCAKTRDIRHYESLLRMQGEEGSLTSAWPVIQAAEKLGAISKIDEFVLDQAVKTLQLHPNLSLAINVSAGTIMDEGAAARYLTRLEKTGGFCKRLIIEVTETLALDDTDRARNFVAKAARLGARFAVDDFGAGHTSFRNLMSIEADYIKIDGSFVSGIATDQQKQTFVRLIVDLAQTLGVETIAEQIDNAADARAIKQMDVDLMQGFYLGRPGAITD